MSQFEKVEFKTIDGVTLRGNFYRAEGNHRPVVVFAEGVTATKEQFANLYAEFFQAAGISVLTYDNRGYGESDGLPRNETNLSQQGADMHDAITAASTMPGVDPDKIAVGGLGHGSTIACIAASDDPRVKAVMLQAVVSGSRDAQSFPPGMLDRVWADRAAKTTAGDSEPTYVRVWPNSWENARGEGEQVWIQGEGPYAVIEAAAARSASAGVLWENKLTLQSFYHLARTEATEYISKIRVPLLYVAAEDDIFSGTVEQHLEGFKSADNNPYAEFILIPAQPDEPDFARWLKPGMRAHSDFLHRVFG